jgi:hypothetical protein
MRTILLLSISFALGCASTPSGAVPARPLSSAELAMGYKDAVDLGASYVASRGHTGAHFERADQPWPNVWCVRFGLLPKGSGRRIELYFDGTQRKLIKEVTYDGVSALVGPP